MVLVKPQSQPVLRPSTGGLRADFDKKKNCETRRCILLFWKNEHVLFP